MLRIKNMNNFQMKNNQDRNQPQYCHYQTNTLIQLYVHPPECDREPS